MAQPENDKNKTTVESQPDADEAGQVTSQFTGMSIPTNVQADLQSVASSLPPQTVIGRYQLEDRLGAGSYGVVYRASDSTLRRSVAIKLLTRFENDQEIDSWLEEARVLASLDHPSIVPVYDIGRTMIGQPFIVSKFMGGGALSKRLSGGRLDTRQIIAWIIQLAEALDYLHHRHVMHRDIKPGNILLADDDRAVLADFGLALPEERYGKGAKFVGTPAYMSPEQARREGHRVDGRSDIYSLGVVLYEMLTGQRPFRANNQDELLECIRTVEVRPLRQLNAEVPRELERICLKTLAKKVVDRYATAGDMADELRGWQQTTLAPGSLSKVTSPIDIGLASDSAPRSAELSNIVVVPHGLRPFDANDADFFKFLLPGARDRHGVPDSLNFWSSRILSRQASDAFRVGVLLGPSGSGKSSLMRAGVMPLVSHKVHSIFVEAKPDGLESTLLKQITQRLPSLRSEGNLVDALIRFRQTPGDSQDMKLLLVIDQFEQWLNMHRDGQITKLHEALRQCDGSQLQAMLLVRDDFMIGLTNFMDEIEEPLLQNKNFATMERFGPAHARSVLAAFGRAYGALDDITSSEQEAFLDMVVEELSRAGNFEPVHLALLAEMIKDKPWNRSTFRALGGLQGLGVSFLEERLAGPAAHPLLRSEIQTVRRVLTELLPPDDTVIKPQPRTEQTIIERLSGLTSPETIDKVLHLLDTEVRLITPTSSALTLGSTLGSTGSTSSVIPAYQLTHDYLVPTIRKWLTAAEEGTRAGRVRVLLRELAASWNASPTTKRLPSILEWLSIRWFTRARHWNQGERRMLRALERRLGLFALGSASVLGAGWFVYQQADQRMQVDTFATRLLEADTDRIADVLHSMGRYRSLVARKLSPQLGNPSLSLQQQFHMALLQLDQAPAQQQVLQHLALVDDAQLAPLIEYVTERYQAEDLQSFKQLVAAALSVDQPETQVNLLPTVALLARLDAKQAAAPSILAQLVPLLGKKNQIDIAHWIEILKPIKDQLVPEMLRVGASGTLAPEAADNYLTLLLEWADEDADSLASALGWAPLERLKRIVQHPRDSSRLAIAIRQRLNDSRNSPPENPSDVDPQAVQVLEPFGGVVKARCAWVESLPLAKMNEAIAAMRQSGYSPLSVRPYWPPHNSKSAPTLQTCIVWHKLDRMPIIKHDMSFEELKSQFDQMKATRHLMVDLARYPDRDQASGSGKWMALWHEYKENEQLPEQQLNLQSLTLSDDDEQPDEGQLKFHVTRCVDWLDEKGDIQQLSLHQLHATPLRSVNWSRVVRANGDMYPNCRVFDARFQWTLDQSERGKLWSDIHYYLEAWQAKKELSFNNIASTARRLLAVDQAELASQLIQSLTDELIDKQPADRKPDLLKLRIGLRLQLAVQTSQADEALSQLNQLQSLESVSENEKVYWQARVTLATKGVEQFDVAWLDKLASATSTAKKEDEVRYLKLLALIAEKTSSDDALSKLKSQLDEKTVTRLVGAKAELLARARKELEDERLGQEFLEVEFDSLRSQADWQALMQSQGLTERMSMAGVPIQELTPHVLYPEISSTHAQRAASVYARGYLPVAWHVSPGLGQLRSMSVWHRPQKPNSDLATQAESKAKLTMALSLLGENDALQEVLSGNWGRGLAMSVAINAWRTIPAESIIKLLKQSDSPDLQLGAIIALGNYNPSTLSADARDYALTRLRQWAAGTPQAALMNHARWCLSKWNETLPEQTQLPDVAQFFANQNGQPSKTNWFVNSLGQQMIVLDVDEKVGVGNDYKRAWVRIKRKFALGTTEVTGKQIREFLADPRLQNWIAKMKSERRIELVDKDLPQSEMAWVVAIMYSQWLNERENIPPEQWCYRNVFSDDNSLPIPEPNYMQRTGYRLPTYAEWVVACQAQSNEYWHFGCDIRVANQFEWSQANAGEEAHPVAQLLPNHFGFYDMGGNLVEWSDTIFRPPLRNQDHYWLEDAGNQEVKANSYAYQLGGRFAQPPTALTHRNYKVNPPHYMSSTSGFRVARTVPK